MSYVDSDVFDEWNSFQESANGNWDNFISRLKTEYPEFVMEELGSMEQLRKLCREFHGISLSEEEKLMNFKRKFSYVASKCLAPPALAHNREIAELFVKTLDKEFQS